jgi:hypothetical protein
MTYPPQGGGGGGITKLSELEIDTQGFFKTDIATVASLIEATLVADAALYFRALPDEYIALIADNANLTAAKAASIFDNANLTAAKAASIFDNANLTAAKAASIFDNANLTAAKAASIFDNANLTVAKAASIFANTNLTLTRINSIVINDGIGDARAQDIVDSVDYATRSLLGAAAIYYVLDDWEDNKLPSRDSRATTAAEAAFNNIFAQKIFRPAWTDVTGTATASSSQIHFTTAFQKARADCTLAVGTWIMRSKVQSVVSNGRACFDIFFTDTDNWYEAFMSPESGNNFGSLKKVAGIGTYLLLTSPSISANTFYETKITRDASGNFEQFLDGVSKGTFTDTSFTSTNYIALGEYEGAVNVDIDWIKIK